MAQNDPKWPPKCPETVRKLWAIVGNIGKNKKGGMSDERLC
jgi:hypothetical protein